MSDKTHGHKIASRIVAIAACSLAIVLVFVGVASAHGGAEITVTPTQAGPGDNITISGEGFESGSDVAVTLESVTGVYQLATLAVADDGTFMGDATLPDVQAGSYQIKAAGGDDSTQLDFTVGAAATPTTMRVATPTTANAEGTATATPTTASAASSTPTSTSQQAGASSSGSLTYSRTTADDIVAGVVLGLFLVGAVALLVLSPRRHSRSNNTPGAA